MDWLMTLSATIRSSTVSLAASSYTIEDFVSAYALKHGSGIIPSGGT